MESRALVPFQDAGGEREEAGTAGWRRKLTKRRLAGMVCWGEGRGQERELAVRGPPGDGSGAQGLQSPQEGPVTSTGISDGLKKG